MSEKIHMSIRMDSKLVDWIDECVGNKTLENRSSGIEFMVTFFRQFCIDHTIRKDTMTRRERAILPFTREKWEMWRKLEELFQSEGITERYEKLEKDFCERFNVPIEKLRLRDEIGKYGPKGLKGIRRVEDKDDP